jgi:hypothetical protein
MVTPGRRIAELWLSTTETRHGGGHEDHEGHEAHKENKRFFFVIFVTFVIFVPQPSAVASRT